MSVVQKYKKIWLLSNQLSIKMLIRKVPEVTSGTQPKNCTMKKKTSR